MHLKDQLAQDLKSAMKDKDTVRKNTVQMVRAAILQYEKDNRTELDDDGIIDVIARELKQRRDSLPDFEKSGRQDLIDGLKAEIAILLAYLPAQLSEEEVQAIVKEAIAKTGAVSIKDMGKVMGIAVAQTKGRADAKQVGEIAKQLLS